MQSVEPVVQNHETVIEAARGWIQECSWADLDTEAIARLPPAQVLAGVQAHYCGGLSAFLRDGDLVRFSWQHPHP